MQVRILSGPPLYRYNMELLAFYAVIALAMFVYFIKETPRSGQFTVIAIGCSLLWPLTLLFFFMDKD